MKASELTGAALDWAVAQAAGYKPSVYSTQSIRAELPTGGVIAPFMPGFRWDQGGPIIEREGIAVTRSIESWCAYSAEGTHEVRERTVLRWARKQTGPTPLVAAMRCFVASKLGDEVNIPAELTA